MDSEKVFPILKQDLDFEIRAINLYYENLFSIGDSKTRSTLLRILIDSLRHALTIANIISSINSDLKIQDEIPREKLIAVLNRGLKEEMESEEIYQEHMKLIVDPEVIKKIRPIFGDEILHEKLVKDLLNKLK